MSGHPRFDLAVFDMAGTTVSDGDAVHASLQEALLHKADVRISRDDANDVMGIPKPVAIGKILAARLPGRQKDADLVRSIYEDFERRMTEYYRSSPSVCEVDGAAEVFRLLRRSGIKVALDTGFGRTIADNVLRRLGWREGLVDAVVTADDVENGRPAPDMIFRAMQRCGAADAGRVIKIGDTPVDLLEGANAGCGMVVGVTRGSHTAEQLARYPHTHLIETVAQLPRLLQASLSSSEPGC